MVRRINPKHRPQMDEATRRWLFQTAHRNYWKVAGHYELDDLISDGFLCWQIVINKYADSVYSKVLICRPGISRPAYAVLMRLFQTTYRNHIINLAKYRTRYIEMLGGLEVLAPIAAVQELGTLAVMIEQAPAPIKAVLELFTTEAGRKKLQSQYRRRSRHGLRETANDRLCRLTGYPDNTELVWMIQQYFGRAK